MDIEEVKVLLLEKMAELLRKDLKSFLSDNVGVQVGHLAEIYKILSGAK
jgi:hypothetical protein